MSLPEPHSSLSKSESLGKIFLISTDESSVSPGARATAVAADLA